MDKKLVVLTDKPTSAWLEIVIEALSSLGNVYSLSTKTVLTDVQELNTDLIFIDVSTIDVDGCKIMTALQRREKRTPIIVVAASPTWQLARELLLSGAVDYVPRTLEKEKLLAISENALARYQLWAEAK